MFCLGSCAGEISLKLKVAPTLLLKHLVNSATFNVTLSHYAAMSHICIINAKWLVYRLGE